MNTNHESRITNHDLLADLPPVSDMMRSAGLEPKKSLGQNFLFDLNLTGKIAKSVPNIENTIVIEVGPGPGGLTRALLTAGAKKVIAIEKDKTCRAILEQIANTAGSADDGHPRLEIIFGDALRIFNNSDVSSRKNFRRRENFIRDRVGLGNSNITASEDILISRPHQIPDNLALPNFRNDTHFAICSNLPYNIGTELLIRWLHMIADDNKKLQTALCKLHSLTLMFQREVAQRIVARPGDAQYGRLSVLTALVADAKILFNVPRTAFTPMPKVESAVIQIIPKKLSVISHQLSDIEKLTAKLFGQRRKMIRGIMPGVDWAQFGLTGSERAEELTPEKFMELSAII
jgi:16S rRNA (adenine1518-N6/adenine1519-N6)-dimethyltransferase